MSNHEQPTPSHPKSDVRNTIGKNKQTPQGSARTTFAVDLKEFYEKHYEKLLPIMADKYECEQRKKEKLEEVNARLDFGEAGKKTTRAQESAYYESRTMSPKRQRRSRSPRHNPSVFTRMRRERSRSPRHEYKDKARREGAVYTESHSESEDSKGGHRKSKSRRKESRVEDDDLSQPWVCAETDPFTSRICHFDFPKMRMPSHVKTYNGSEDPEDHLKIFQAAAKTERWVMPTWCHMFNSTLTGNARVWFDDLSLESIDSYNDLREAFLKNYLQQKKCIIDPIVLHNIKQRDVESTEDFIQRYKSESGNVKGAPECMRISGFVHEITNPELIKRFQENIPKTVDEMMQVATSFLQGQEAASNQERKKPLLPGDTRKGVIRRILKKEEAFAANISKRKCRTDECNHLRKQIEDILKAGKLSHIIRELKQSSEKDQPKKKGETSEKEKPQAILMIQLRQTAIRQKITQSFSPNPEMLFPHLRDDEGAEGPLIIEAEIGGHQVHRICIDGGSSFEILYEHCFNRLRPEIKNQMVPATTSLIGFSGEIKWPLGQITLLVKIGDDEHSTSAWMDFMVVRSTSPHNGIIGRPGLRKIQAVPSTTHGMIKFPVTGGILTLKSSKIIPVECAMVSEPEEQPISVNKVREERVKVAINPEHPEQTVMIGFDLTEKTIGKLCNLLQRSLDIFSWTPTDMTSVPMHIAEHRLNVRKGCQPVRQKKRGQAAERNKAINDEVSKLVAAGIMREVHYHDWLSNPMMVKKSDNSWRMCVDFKDLNKACPKDGYPLPEIDWKVESLCGFPFKCFLDAYKGLRKAGATYQGLVDKAFHGQIGRNLKVYVDDLVIKIRTEDEVVRDIEETFKTLRKINMKLNPKKCTFGVEEGMFLGYQVNTRGIKICPDKVDAVLSLQSPKCLKDVQKLNGKLASLNRFLAKSAEKSLPFFKTLKKCTKKSDFLWTEEAEAAFRQMKEHIAKLPMLTTPEEQEELIVYLAASKEVVSAVLMTEREDRQMPIYFVSRALRGPEVNYTPMEKVVLALVHASKRLRRYFQAHPIIVITDHPIKNILSNPEVAGRMQKWSIQLGEFGIHYRPRVSVKGQVLSDFIIERPKEEGQDDSAKEEEPLPAQWTLFTDGSSCVDGCGAGVILTDPEGVGFTYALRFQFKATNNEAEYEALIAGLRIAEKIGIQSLQVNVDSKLVANQVNGTYITKETDMIKYLEKVKTLASTFPAFSIKQVPRSKNKKADALSKIASTSFAHLSKQVLVEELKEKSVNESEVLVVVEEEGESWMTPIHEYLTDETLPAERKNARAIKRKSQRFAIINGILYKKSFLGPWLRCVGPLQANYILREIHEGSCSMHAGTQSVVAKALRIGYY
ncbi:reverse transcriptase domain-containing protein [Tanacetum coccineum]